MKQKATKEQLIEIIEPMLENMGLVLKKDLKEFKYEELLAIVNEIKGDKNEMK